MIPKQPIPVSICGAGRDSFGVCPKALRPKCWQQQQQQHLHCRRFPPRHQKPIILLSSTQNRNRLHLRRPPPPDDGPSTCRYIPTRAHPPATAARRLQRMRVLSLTHRVQVPVPLQDDDDKAAAAGSCSTAMVPLILVVPTLVCAGGGVLKRPPPETRVPIVPRQLTMRLQEQAAAPPPRPSPLRLPRSRL